MPPTGGMSVIVIVRQEGQGNCQQHVTIKTSTSTRISICQSTSGSRGGSDSPVTHSSFPSESSDRRTDRSCRKSRHPLNLSTISLQVRLCTRCCPCPLTCQKPLNHCHWQSTPTIHPTVQLQFGRGLPIHPPKIQHDTQLPRRTLLLVVSVARIKRDTISSCAPAISFSLPFLFTQCHFRLASPLLCCLQSHPELRHDNSSEELLPSALPHDNPSLQASPLLDDTPAPTLTTATKSFRPATIRGAQWLKMRSPST